MRVAYGRHRTSHDAGGGLVLAGPAVAAFMMGAFVG
jgi:hypothetical protein